MSKVLVINADDFGFCPEVDEGILTAFHEGVVRSTSLLVTFPERLAASVALLRDAPELSPGLHLDLTWGPDAWPEGVGLCNADGCRLRTAGRLLARLAPGILTYEQVAEAVFRQFETYVRTGLPLTHVDTHQHVLFLPKVYPVVQQACQKYNVRYLRHSIEAPWGLASQSSRRWIMRAFALGRRFGAALPVVGTVDSGRWTAQALAAVIGRLPDGVAELVCHPGLAPAAELSCACDGARGTKGARNEPGASAPSRERGVAPDGLAYSRADELAALCSREVRSAIEQNAVVLKSFQDV